MNKSLYIMAFAVATLLTGCSTGDGALDLEEGIPAAGQPGSIFTSATSNSEIPIQLGFGSQSMTRSPLDSEVGTGLFETPSGQYLGVFGLAQQPQPIAEPTHPGPVDANSIDWVANPDGLMTLMTLNHPASVTIVDAGSKLGTITTSTRVSEVRFRNPSTMDPQTYFYPMGGWYNYYFYGYYPRQESGVNVSSNKITVDFTLDGSQDVVWGKAVPYTDGTSQFPASDLTSGFNARYFRQKASSGITDQNVLPHLALKHSLTMVKFFVICDDTEGYTDYVTGADPNNFQLAGMSIDRMPVKWTLTVADRYGASDDEDLTTEGKLLLTDPDDPNLLSTPIYIHKDDDSNPFESGNRINIPLCSNPESSALIRSESVYVGYAMIPTTDMIVDNLDAIGNAMGDHDGQNLKNPFVKLKFYLNGKEVDADSPVTHKIGGDDLNLQRGKIYNVYLKVKVPDALSARATLDHWEEAGDLSDRNIEQDIE